MVRNKLIRKYKCALLQPHDQVISAYISVAEESI